MHSALCCYAKAGGRWPFEAAAACSPVCKVLPGKFGVEIDSLVCVFVLFPGRPPLALCPFSSSPFLCAAYYNGVNYEGSLTPSQRHGEPLLNESIFPTFPHPFSSGPSFPQDPPHVTRCLLLSHPSVSGLLPLTFKPASFLHSTSISLAS